MAATKKTATKKGKPKRREWPIVKRTKYRNGSIAYMVDTRLRGEGSRVFKPTLEEANEVARQARIRRQNEGIGYFSLEGDQRLDAERALAMLAPFGKTLVDAVEFYVPHLKALQSSKSVLEASDAYESNATARNLSKPHLRDIRLRLGRFSETFGDRLIAEVEAEEIDEWLDDLEVEAATRNGYRRHLCALWAFAGKRGWCNATEIEKTTLRKENSGKTEVVTPEECKALLDHADPDILPVIAVGAFAGLRRSELGRLQWGHINLPERFVEVVVAGTNTKSAKRRIVVMSDNLAAWLAPYEGRTGSVWPDQKERGRRLLDEAKRAAGFGTPGTETDEEKGKGVALMPWRHNALRHSFASYHLAKHNDAAKVSLEMGHTNSVLVFRHYRQLVRPADAAKYWEVMPTVIP
ncbi:site-specific recombinase XerD [Roseimicrobium gellanilyticum]|uniref:Site-specific recombinase XerD n=1 Tax=Roseimicrobium gellanilyticum TaxID=748857 RepID=A0A366HJ78_9BACT|nr:site-specific integrase [Roseimicrobium gellanilyticum]RBP42425.1 site-specific recombinase XerD [Roseimicrobium gellanilyticum]